jgi:photosystem II stability/assembly factor-like uncharacterized protein
MRMRPHNANIARAFILAIIGVAAVATSTNTSPAPRVAALDSSFASALKWRSIGPDRGGRSIAVSGVRHRPKEAYFGAVGGGLWKTMDGGDTWAPVTDGQIRSASVGAVAVSESNPDVVYIGMGETCIRGNIMAGDGVYRSTDGGKTWTNIGFASSENIAKIRVHPSNPDVVFVAAFGKHSAPNPDRGVYKSTDAGKSWRKVLFRNDSTAAIDLAFARSTPNVMYAALWEAYRKEYTMSSGGSGSGLFKSTDGGETWTEITRNSGLPSGTIGRIGVSVSDANPNRVYALVENENGGLFRSDDAGATWTLVNSNRAIRQRAFYYTHVYADPANQDVVYMQNTSLFRSTDGGKSTTTLGGTHGDHHALWIDPDDTSHLMDGNDGGGAISTNTGLTWTAEDYPTEQFYHVATTAHAPYHLCGSQQDNSTLCTPSDWNLIDFLGSAAGRGGRGFGGGGNQRPPGAVAELTSGGMQVSYEAAGGEPGYIAPDPKNFDVFYSGTNNGGFMDRYDRRTGHTKEVNPYPWHYSGEPAAEIPERWQWTYPIVFSAVDPNVLFAGSQRLWKTTTRGERWTAISGDLTRHDPKTMGHSGGPITGDMNGPEVYAVIFAIGPSKRDVNVIWTGSDDGLVHVTRDGGASWTNVTPPEMPQFGRVSQIDASAFDVGTAYVSVRRPLLDDKAPYIFRSRDFGKTWTRIVNGIRSDDWVHTVREDPMKRGLLYAGTQHGVYVSFDDGENWQSLSLNLPDVPVSDLLVRGSNLVISTHGRGFYVLDDIAPLREYTLWRSVNRSDWLFTPSTGVRSTAGVLLTYALQSPARRLTITILDSTGHIVRTFVPDSATADSVPRDSAATRDTTKRDSTRADQSGGSGARVGPFTSNAKGVHRVLWDLRYESATTFPGMILWGATTTGPAVPPGRYTVRLNMDGLEGSKTMRVVRNPMFNDVTDADLRAQSSLALRIRDKVSEANDAVILSRNIKREAADRLKRNADAQLRQAGERLTTHLSDVEDDIYQVKNQSGQDPLNFPIRINNRLANLLRVVTTGDGRPIANAPVLLDEYSGLLGVQMTRLQRVVNTDLTAFNAELKRLGLPQISGTCPGNAVCQIVP